MLASSLEKYGELIYNSDCRVISFQAILPKTARVHDKLCFILEFHNHGYAAPVKDLKLYFILASISG